MTVSIGLFKSMLQEGSCELDRHIEEFSQIDSLFGDGDHGVTMQRISKEIREVTLYDYNSISELLMELSKRVMNVNGGSAGPLYGMLFDGFAEGVEGMNSLDVKSFNKMLISGAESFASVSTAQIGDKTMVDTLVTVLNRVNSFQGELPELMKEIAKSAMDGAESTKNFVAKFGRARFHKKSTLGTMDAGAYSLACFFVGFSNGFLSQ